ncbi:hypothetical protein GOP47_0029689 [Adiantum capillus-veneris]|nr:hypothetical protein GOP47_0029689 [Adiantum capillus-veneris]
MLLDVRLLSLILSLLSPSPCPLEKPLASGCELNRVVSEHSIRSLGATEEFPFLGPGVQDPVGALWALQSGCAGWESLISKKCNCLGLNVSNSLLRKCQWSLPSTTKLPSSTYSSESAVSTSSAATGWSSWTLPRSTTAVGAMALLEKEGQRIANAERHTAHT